MHFRWNVTQIFFPLEVVHRWSSRTADCMYQQTLSKISSLAVYSCLSLTLTRYAFRCKVCVSCWKRGFFPATYGRQCTTEAASVYCHHCKHIYIRVVVVLFWPFLCPFPAKYLADWGKVLLFSKILSLSTPLCISLSFVHYTYNVIIQGKGFPDVNTRMMVRCLWSTLQIPILALVDADPHGNFKCFTFFTLDGVVKISPPKGKSLLKQFTCFMNLSFLWEFAVDKLLTN